MAKRKSYGAELENRRIQVWWPLDSRYYTCRVLKFNERSRKHKVKYEDSDEENLDLSREKWRMVLDDPPEEAEAGKELVDEGRGQGKDGEVVMVGEEPREGIVAMDTSKMRAAVDSSPRTRKTRVRLRGKNSGAGNSMGQLTPRRGPGRPKGSPNMKPISRPTSRSASRTTTPRLRKQDPSTPMHIEEEAALGDVETSRERRNSGDREEVDEFDEEMDTTTREENVELDTAKQKVLQSFRADLGVIMDKLEELKNHYERPEASVRQKENGTDGAPSQGHETANTVEALQVEVKMLREQMFLIQQEESIRRAEMLQLRSDLANYMGHGGVLPVQIGFARGLNSGRDSPAKEPLMTPSNEPRQQSQAPWQRGASAATEDHAMDVIASTPVHPATDTTGKKVSDVDMGKETNGGPNAAAGASKEQAESKSGRTEWGSKQPKRKSTTDDHDDVDSDDNDDKFRPKRGRPAKGMKAGTQSELVANAHPILLSGDQRNLIGPTNSSMVVDDGQAPAAMKKLVGNEFESMSTVGKNLPVGQLKVPEPLTVATTGQSSSRPPQDIPPMTLIQPHPAAETLKLQAIAPAPSAPITDDKGSQAGDQVGNSSVALEESQEGKDTGGSTAERPKMDAYQMLAKTPRTVKDQRDIAKCLVAISSSIWVVENASEPKDTDYVSWARDVGRHCMVNVAKIISSFSHVPDAMMVLRGKVREEVKEFDWLLSPSRDRHFVKARANYSVWKPPLTDSEWSKERVLLKGIQTRFFKGVAEQKKLQRIPELSKMDPQTAPLVIGIEMAQCAADAILTDSDLDKIRLMDVRVKQPNRKIVVADSKATSSLET